MKRIDVLHKQARLWDDFCGSCPFAYSFKDGKCKSAKCPINGEMQEYGVWLAADMKSRKPIELHENTVPGKKKKAKA